MTVFRTMGRDGRLRASANVSARQFDEEWILLDLEGGNYFALDDLGGAVWQELIEGRSPSEIADRLKANYDVDFERLVADIVALGDELISKGLMAIRLETERR